MEQKFAPQILRATLVVGLLLTSNVTIGSAQPPKKSPGVAAETFYDVAVFGTLNEVKTWIRKDASLVTAKDERGFTALHGVVGEDRPEVARLLIAKGADVNAQTRDGTAPLHVAAYPEMVGILVEAGAKVDLVDNEGRTPLIVQAAEPDSEAVMEALLQRGANVGARDKSGETALTVATAREETRKVELLKRFPEQTHSQQPPVSRGQ